jgi:hypothetical protein
MTVQNVQRLCSRNPPFLRVAGTKIDFLVPGGPAHFSQKLEKEDEILEVDGVKVNFENVVGCLQGSDMIGSKVRLQVCKQQTGQLVDVELTRVSKTSLENLVRIFQTLTLLKQNGHNNEEYEQMYSQDQELTKNLVDKLEFLISQVQIEKYNAEISLKKNFQEIYEDLRSHLVSAYEEIDFLRALEKSNSDATHDDAQRLIAELESRQTVPTEIPVEITTKIVNEDVPLEVVRYVDQQGKVPIEKVDADDLEKKMDARSEKARDEYRTVVIDFDRTTKLISQTDDVDVLRNYADAMAKELDINTKALEKELEEGMQREFEIRRLNAQFDLTLKELEMANNTLLAKDRELQQRVLEDQDLAQKLKTLQGVLQQCMAESANYKSLNEKLQRQLADSDNQTHDATAGKESAMEAALAALAHRDKTENGLRAELQQMREERTTATADIEQIKKQAASSEERMMTRLKSLEEEGKLREEKLAKADSDLGGLQQMLDERNHKLVEADEAMKALVHQVWRLRLAAVAAIH